MKGRLCFRALLSHLLASRTATWLLVMVAMGIAVTLLNVYILCWFQYGVELGVGDKREMRICAEEQTSTPTPPLPTFWLYHDTERSLGHVITVFNRIGYVQGGPGSWDVLWSHPYPFISLRHLGPTLLPHQRINHFPGSGCFTSKPQLASLNLPYLPRAFRMPQQADQLRDEAAQHPEKLWVQKNNLHRGIKLRPIHELNFDLEGTFIQEFISNPLLIAGRKFDIGMYTVITSIDPLRAYTYDEEVLLRFCSKDYLPFDPSDLKKYVVDDNYTPTWEVPTLTKLSTDQQFSNKQIFNTVLRKMGHNPQTVWNQISTIIAEVLTQCHSRLIDFTARFTPSPRYFFELVRFDFVVDETLAVWLMEVNLSPNLSSGHTHGNRIMYEQILFNLLSLVGVARASGTTTPYNGEYESVMLVSEGDIQVPLDECWNQKCGSCTAATVCSLCSSCRGEKESFVLKTAFLEHKSRRNFRRVLPHPLTPPLLPPPSPLPPPPPRSSSVRVSDQVMHLWFAGKCRDDVTWCT